MSFSGIVLSSFSQITTKEYPPSFLNTSVIRSTAVELVELPKPNVKELIKEDQLDKELSKPWRFGTLIPTNLNLNNSGKWEPVSPKSTRWTLHLFSEDAISINLNFDQFKLSKGAQLFIYNNDYSDIIGALTFKNNKKDGSFAIRPILGQQINLELIIPNTEIKENELSIHQLVYGYRNVREKSLKVFNSSGSCNININCKEGNQWQDIKRSVVMITASNNTRICTGALVNNVRQDSTPYLLTASHCRVDASAIFIFNYESSSCDPSVDGSLSNSITGASQRAQAASSDFHLLELSSTPPPSYNVFYAGWSAINSPAPKSVTIHHPMGDVKKISIDNDTLIKSGFNDPNGSTHWMVRNWEKGTTEGRSSGAPLFDLNRRLIGQLHGGDASCAFNAQDYYGKFAISWNNDTNASRQLKVWLDPDNTNTLILDGLDTKSASFQNDLQLLYIGGLANFTCDSTISHFFPYVVVRNVGSDTISSLKVNYSIDNQAMQSTSLNTVLARQEIAKIDLSQITVQNGLHRIEASAFFNSTKTDQDSSNNIQILDFETNDQPIEVNISLKTDDFGREITWSMISPEGIKIADGGPYRNIVGGDMDQKSVCAYDSCFTVFLLDKEDDGFNGLFGDGYFLVTKANGDTLLFEDNFTTKEKELEFCITGSPSSLPEIKDRSLELSIFPNPVRVGNSLNIVMNNSVEELEYHLIDLSGRLVLSFKDEEKFIIPETIEPGIYLIEIRSTHNSLRKANCKLIILK